MQQKPPTDAQQFGSLDIHDPAGNDGGIHNTIKEYQPGKDTARKFAKDISILEFLFLLELKELGDVKAEPRADHYLIIGLAVLLFLD